MLTTNYSKYIYAVNHMTLLHTEERVELHLVPILIFTGYYAFQLPSRTSISTLIMHASVVEGALDMNDEKLFDIFGKALVSKLLYCLLHCAIHCAAYDTVMYVPSTRI